MKIAIGNDQAGVQLKRDLTEYIESLGHEVVNFGTDTTESVDYPVYAEKVARAVVSGQCDRGVLICGTGLGISIAANKIRGVRCAHCTESCSTALSRRHNDANIVAVGARIIGPELAKDIVKTFLETGFEGGRHARRVGLIAKLENGETLS